MEKKQKAYNNAKDERNKINGEGSDYPWTARFVKCVYKKYVRKYGTKPSRKLQLECAMMAKINPQNADDKLDAFGSLPSFLTNLIKRERLQ